MRTHTAATAAAGLALATITACSTTTPTPPKITPTPPTPYQAALTAICDRNITITPRPGQQPWVPAAWRAGFCHDPYTQTFNDVQQAVARSANAVRVALVANPPQCALAQDTPAEPFCPYPYFGR